VSVHEVICPPRYRQPRPTMVWRTADEIEKDGRGARTV